jgi:DeoR family transcriptional regulator, fructose operon transcriptional repressor
MFAEKRRQQILERIHQTPAGAIQVIKLAQEFSVSGMTIRRDLELLQERGLLHRVHGGAISSVDAKSAASYTERRREFSRAKAQIGMIAAQLICDGDHIILDSGTTTLQIARNLFDHNDLTIVTNSLSIPAVLPESFNGHVVALGGEVRLDEGCTIGPVAARELAQYSVDRAFISAAGFSLAKGATDVFFPEVEVKQAMIRSAREVILVSDSSKWQVERLIRIAEIQSFQKIITDDGFPQAAMDALEAMGIEVITPRTWSTKSNINLEMESNHGT